MDPLLIGLGAAALLLLMRKKKKAAVQPVIDEDDVVVTDDDVDDDVDDDDDVVPGKKPPKKPAGKYIGSGWTNWPHKDLFPNTEAIGQTLSDMGYPGWIGWFLQEGPTSAAAKAEAKRFQADWNIFRKWVIETSGDTPAAPKLGIDGLLGPKTMNALGVAVKATGNEPWAWIDYVQTAKNELGEG